MRRTRRTASTAAKVSLSIAALLVSSDPLAAESADIVLDSSSTLKVRFHDNSAYAQLSRIRNLSFLTIVDSGKSRWFVGVNSDGILGLHYRPTSRHDRDSYADLVRLRYLDSYRTLNIY